MYWLNLGRDEQVRVPVGLNQNLLWQHLLGGVGVGQRDSKHAHILLSHKVGIKMRQTHQSCRRQQTASELKGRVTHAPLQHRLHENTDRKRKNSLERNSSIGDAMATVAEMCVSLTMSAGRSLIMMSGISTVHMVRATTHCLAQR